VRFRKFQTHKPKDRGIQTDNGRELDIHPPVAQMTSYYRMKNHSAGTQRELGAPESSHSLTRNPCAQTGLKCSIHDLTYNGFHIRVDEIYATWLPSAGGGNYYTSRFEGIVVTSFDTVLFYRGLRSCLLTLQYRVLSIECVFLVTYMLECPVILIHDINLRLSIRAPYRRIPSKSQPHVQLPVN
jgi:hypothetical protein